MEPGRDSLTIDQFEFKTEEFQGPLEKLVELIDSKELEITRFNLAKVTGDFIDYMNSLEQINQRELAEFVSVAARLILIKSHALLPQLELTDEEEQDIHDLEAKLKLYKELKEAERLIEDNWDKNPQFSREFLANTPRGFYLTEKVDPKELRGYLNSFMDFVKETKREPAKEIKMVSLEEKVREVLERIRGVIEISFNHLSDGKDKGEVVILFLALLHLVKDNEIVVVQEGTFSEIKIVDEHA